MVRPEFEQLVARAQDGDVRAFEQLVDAHLAQVRRFARAFSASEADADDLAQEALIKAYRSLHQYRRSAAFSSWLYAVVRNLFLDFARSRAGRERAHEDPLDPARLDDQGGAPAPDALLEAEQDRSAVWRALRAVPLEFRTALVLFDVEGHSYEEVAAIERVPVGTVKSRLARGRAHLRAILSRGAEPHESASSAAPGTSGPAVPSQVRRSGS